MHTCSFKVMVPSPIAGIRAPFASTTVIHTSPFAAQPGNGRTVVARDIMTNDQTKHQKFAVLGWRDRRLLRHIRVVSARTGKARAHDTDFMASARLDLHSDVHFAHPSPAPRKKRNTGTTQLGRRSHWRAGDWLYFRDSVSTVVRLHHSIRLLIVCPYPVRLE